MRQKFVEGLDYRLVVLKPQDARGQGKRSSFKIEKRSVAKKKGGHQKLEHPDIDAINDRFHKGRINFEQAYDEVLNVRDRLYKEWKAVRAVVGNEKNQELLKDYWKSEYEDRPRENIDRNTAYYELERAVEAVGMLSLYSASAQELQNEVNKRLRGNKQRRVVGKLNVLLRFAGRAHIRLVRARKEKMRVKHLSPKEFEKLFLPTLRDYLDHHFVQSLPEKARELDIKKAKKLCRAIELLHVICFYTGTRIGEAFAFQESDLDKRRSEVKVILQLDKQGVQRDTKNKIDRKSFIFPKAAAVFKEWVEVKSLISLTLRKHMSKHTGAVCELAFPGTPEKHLRFHDTRHCYAIALLSKGVGLDIVAQMIGDSATTCREHYVGYIVSDDAMELVRTRVLHSA